MSATTDWAALYRANVAALRQRIGSLTDAELAMAVPSSPRWTVRDVVAHVAGVASDNVTGRMDDAPGEVWTSRHVDERASRRVDELFDELDANADGIARVVAEAPVPACVWDLVVHHADIVEALGDAADPSLWQPVLESAAGLRMGRLPVAVRTPSGTIGTGETLVGATDYELFQALFSRRSRAQLNAWPVHADGGLTCDQIGEALDNLPIFGPRDDDVAPPTDDGATR